MDKKNAEISARIAELISKLGENPSSFAKKLGYQRAQTMYDILNGKSAPSYDFFYRFVNTEISVDVNLRWLLSGEGEIFQDKTYSTNVQQPIYLIEKIASQAEEIGQLREQIKQLRKEKEKDVLAVSNSNIVNVG